MSESHLLSLCYALGNGIFLIDIPASNTVLQLEEAIRKARNIPSEQNFNLWQVTSSIAADKDLLETHNLLNESKKLSAVRKKLSTVFFEPLDQENLHIVVEFPDRLLALRYLFLDNTDSAFLINIAASSTIAALELAIKDAHGIPSVHQLILRKVVSAIPADEEVRTYKLSDHLMELPASH
ncbi:hypothetical protein AMATHDRAFT_50280, partial [Amanita thiersii Skay4041]